jgi:deoxyribodipyrimidine photo-lyase
VSGKPALVWFRVDLRLSDNPALAAAIASGSAVIPVFIWAPDEEGGWPPGAASRWWLHQSLEDLQGRLAGLGSRMIVRSGPSAGTLLDLACETGAGSVFWNRRYEPAAMILDRYLTPILRENGLRAESEEGNLLFEPGDIRNSSGKPFQVFTAFWRACLAAPAPPSPLRSPRRIPAPPKWPRSLTVADLGLEPEVDWAGGLRKNWKPGEKAAARQLKLFLARHAANYAGDRDRPDHAGTSRLSPHLHFGEISARQIWHAMRGQPSGAYIRQLGWREFAHHLLFHFPHTPEEPLRPEFRAFPWRMNAAKWNAWTTGKTGYPLVDAGMRELWHTGWMHNRVRMIAASFLVKHLLISWQEGAAWFWDTLVDADLANNTLGWQWVAGCGADAAPYFRIFNPVLQGEKFDPQGDYVRRWAPELSQMPAKWVHHPWKAPREVRSAAAVVLGNTYPRPLTGHEAARKQALAAFTSMKSRRVR